MNKNSSKGLEQIIQDQWKKRMCPIVNGITFGDGRIFQLELQNIENELSSQVIAKTNVRAFMDKFGDYWTSVISLCEIQLPQRNLILTGGEGGLGGDGFIALSRISDDYLNWLVFFEDANPFIEVSVDNKTLMVTGVTTLGNVWQFSINEPEHIKVVGVS